MTEIIKTETTCDRCDTDLEKAAIRHLDEGGPAECPRCGLGFELSAEWLADHGYEGPGGFRTVADDPRSWCPDCGAEDELVRPGKTQPTCDCHEHCPVHGPGMFVYHPEGEVPGISGWFCKPCQGAPEETIEVLAEDTELSPLT